MMKKLLCLISIFLLSIGFVQGQADIELVGNGTVIVDGQTAISTADDTDFGSTDVGIPVVTQFTINNTGTTDLFLSLPPSINDLGTGTADWSTTSPAFQIIPAGTTTFDVTFNPSSAGAQTVEILIISNDPDESPFTFNIGGTGTLPVGPDIEVVGNGTVIVDGQTTISTADDTDFGSTQVGTPVVKQFTINNTGTTDLFISLPPAINDLGTGTLDWSTTNPSFQVIPAGTTTFDVTFNPSISGAQSVQISITSNDPDESPFTFNIGGTGTLPAGPDIEIQGNATIIVDGQTAISTTDDTDFGSTPVGTPVVHQFTINNTGTTDLFLSLPPSLNDLGTGTADWSTTSPAFQIIPAGTSTFDVTFNPSVAGAQTIQFSLISNDPDESPFTFNMGGTGTAVLAPDIEIVGNSTIIIDGQTAISTTDDTDFGTTIVGIPVVHQFTINNTGNADLFINLPPSINDLGSGTSDWSTTNPNFQVIPSGTTTFDVTFTPSVAGVQTVEFSITSNDPDESPFTFNLGGTGVDNVPEMDVFGNGLEIVDGDTTPDPADDTDFGQADVSTGNVGHTFTIENTGADILNLTDPSPFVTITGVNSSDFVLTLVPSTPVAAAGNTTFEITFNPSALGIRTATVSIANDDADENPYNFDIQGEGIDANVGAPLLITQYYEGTTGNQWIEVKNISQSTVIAGSYFLALYTNFNTLFGTINTIVPDANIAIGTMAPDAVRIFRNPAALLPSAGNLGTAPITPTLVCTFDGNDVILISSTNDATAYDNRIDIVGVVDAVTPRIWGRDKGFIKGCNTNEQPSTTFDATIGGGGAVTVNDYIELSTAEVDAANNLTNIALGTQGVGTTTWTTSWDNEVPGRTRRAVISGTYNASDGTFDVCDLIITGDLNLDGGTNNFVQVYNDLTINGTFTIGDTESLHMDINNEDAVISGSITKIESSTSLVNNLDFTYWASPVTGATIGSTFSNADPSRVFYWDQSADDDGPGGDVGDPTITLGRWFVASGTMTRAKGYISQGPSAGAYPQAHTIAFTGTPNNGVISLSGGSNMVFNNDGNAYSDYNLIGNPYPSAIDADEFIGLIDNDGIDGTVYLWTHNTQNNGFATYQYTTDDYASYNLTGGTAAATGGVVPNGNIASGQGFMVRAISPGPGVVFNNAMRLSGGAGENTQNFSTPGAGNTKSAAVVEKDRVWLNAESSQGGAFNQILIGFFDNATDGYDRGYDGLKNGASWVRFYSKIDSLAYGIQGLSSFNVDKKVALGFDTYINEALTYSISIANVEGVLKDNDIYLVDNELNITHDLKLAPYEFDTDGVAYYSDRFSLEFVKSVLGVDDLELNNNFVVINEENALRVRSNNTIVNLKVYDITGRLLVDKKANDNEFTVSTHNIRKGTVLIVNATFDNGAEVSKKAIKY